MTTGNISERAAYYAVQVFRDSIEALPEGSGIDYSQMAQGAALAGFSLDGRYETGVDIPDVDEVNELAKTVLKLSE